MTNSEDISNAKQLDLICNEFEDAWAADSQVDLSLYLNRVKDSRRSQLLRMLLEVEVELKRKSGLTVVANDYLPYGPAALEYVEQLLAQDLEETIAPNSTKPKAVGTQIQFDSNGSTMSPSNEFEFAEGHFGDYEIISEIARGGMGVVYKAKQKSLDRTVALKMILSGQFAGEEEIRRFKSEAAAAAKLDHPGVVPIYEIGEHDGHQFFSMAIVEGESLQDKVKHGPLSPKQAAELVAKIADAMADAHENGVIHRDLKPANVLVDAKGQPRVTDFGLAKKVEGNSSLTGTGQILGTPSYMPPEQASGDTTLVDERSDIYAIGAILYCLLTGRPPFQASSLVDTLMQVMEKQPVKPTQLDGSIPKSLENICLKCLEKDASQRYQKASELEADLSQFLASEDAVRQYGKRGSTHLDHAEKNPSGAFSTVNWWAIGAIFLIVVFGFIGWQSWGDYIFSPNPGSSSNALPDAAPEFEAVEVKRFDILASRNDSPFSKIEDLNQLQLGDAVRFSIELSDPAYVKLFWLDAKGRKQELYPNDPETGNRASDPVMQIESPVQLDRGWPLEELTGPSELALLLVSRDPIADDQLSDLKWESELKATAVTRYVASRQTSANLTESLATPGDKTRGFGKKSKQVDDEVLRFLEQLRQRADIVHAVQVPTAFQKETGD